MNNSHGLRKRAAVAIMTGVLFLMSCGKGFLNVTPNHYLTEGDYYQSDEDFVQAVNAVYGDLQKYIKQAHFLQEGRSDNTTYDNFLDQGSLGGSRQWGFMDQFVMDANARIISDAWSMLYSAIKDCNVPLFYLKQERAELDPDLMKRLEGELRFLRAYFYFVAVRYWGDIPLILEPINTPEAAFSFTRSSVDEVYKTIVADAEFAESVLPEKYDRSDVGRATKGAAQTLLAEIFMTRHEYKKAELKLREIMDLGTYSLLTDYADIFNPANKNNAESIFEVQFKEGSEGESSNFMYTFAPRNSAGVVINVAGAAGGANLPTRDMVHAFEQGDRRMAVAIDSFLREGQVVYYVNKYNHVSDPSFVRTPDDWPVYRYADVLLMLAEAINEQGYETGEPFDLLNKIRGRAGLPLRTPGDLPDQQTFRKALTHERRVEFAFENHRWFYLLRTSQAVDVMTAYGKIEVAHPTTLPTPNFLPYDETAFKIEKYKLLYPLPANELDKNPNLTQNEGW